MARRQQSGFLAPDDPPSPKYTGVEGDITHKFKLFWKHPGESDDIAPREETYEQRCKDPVQWSKDIIEWFNSTLRPHERKRVFVRCEVIGEVPPAEHDWHKKTAMTQSLPQSRGGAPYDAYVCLRCGVTGKRFGLAPNVILDSAWKRKGVAYKRCDTSMKAQGKWA